MQEENNYSVYEHITPDGMYYFGVSTDIKKRWICNGVNYKTTSLQPYIDKFGWDNIQHQVLFENQTKENALWIEDFLIKTAREDGCCINKNRSGHITEEENYNRNKFNKYREEHREEWNKYQREYREEHREESRTYMRNYMRKYYHRKKDTKTLNELGYIPLF